MGVVGYGIRGMGVVGYRTWVLAKRLGFWLGFWFWLRGQGWGLGFRLRGESSGLGFSLGG